MSDGPRGWMDSLSVGVGGKTYSTGGVDSFEWQLSNSRQGV